jgi:DNA topoisomerase-1
MAKTLLIVESPAKAKTIARYLGRDFQVKASVGHVRDLPPKELGVDVEHGFRPTYHLTRGKGKVIAEIKEAAQSAEQIYLATDPDREGEAIAWHVAEAARLDPAITRRITFHQVTAEAVRTALLQARDLDRDLIDAQQARRVLDRLVGYKISPLLSRAMRKRLSAGRVQSVALRLVVEREREILAFVPVEYWSLEAELQRRIEGKEVLRARLIKIKGEEPNLQERQDVDQILGVLEEAAYTVSEVRQSQRRRNPQPPFVTSTLQAAASNRLRISPQQTMRLAQQLYEGIDLAGERVGLITYMRTDSTHVAPEAQEEARAYILERWGADYLPASPPRYRSRAALAQEAHEAIRPTSTLRTPEEMRPYLDARQAALYELIWQRFVASQMAPAVYDTIRVDILAAKDYLFRATGQRLVFAGHLAVYGADASEEDGDKQQMLPVMAVGEGLDLLGLYPEQHFTQPPPRFTEATLIKELEANGVGRPSTYASIVGVIQDRGYVEKQGASLAPTALGMVVCDTLVETFTDIVDVGYTAQMEVLLDQVAAGIVGYRRMLEGFYGPFERELARAEGLMPQAVEKALAASAPQDVQERICPECGRPLTLRLSRAGRFWGCSGYPECRYTLDMDAQGQPQEKQDVYAEGETCEKCGGRMKVVTRGRSSFLGCENYPTCRNTRPILSDRIKQLAQETACPACGLKPLAPKKGRYGEYLYCPTCNQNYSLAKLGIKGGGAAEIVDIACPECGQSPLEKRAGRYGPYYHCPACNKNTSEKKLAAGT